MWLLRSWVGWTLLVVIGVVWGVPRLPLYHRDLPYIYDLGGTIFVLWYMGLGFLSLGFYGLVTGLFPLRTSWRARLRGFLLGGGSLLLTGILWWLQTVFMNLSVRLG
jgi:hypothetical protein